MYHKVSDNHDHHVENDAHGHPRHLHTVPHGLYPLSTKHSEHNEEWMEEVTHVPPGQHAVGGDFAHTVPVVFSKQLHAHHSKDEHHDGQHQGQVAQSPNWVANNFDQGVKSGPRFSQLEDSELLKITETKRQWAKSHFSTPGCTRKSWFALLPVGMIWEQTCQPHLPKTVPLGLRWQWCHRKYSTLSESNNMGPKRWSWAPFQQWRCRWTPS